MTETHQPASLVGSLIFQIGLVLSVIVWGVLSLFTFPLPYRWRYWFITRWCGWILWLLHMTCGVRVEVQGAEHIPPAGGGVVVSKHQSAWETFALENWFHPQSWVLKRELLRVPLFGWALALLEPIAIDRGAGREAVRQVIRQGRPKLDAGRFVVVFPEGTRVPAGHRGRYRIGGTVLACATGAPVIPVAHNAGEIWPRRGFRLNRGTIRVRIGAPIPSEGRRADELMAELEGWIEAQMPAISARGYPGTPYERAGAG